MPTLLLTSMVQNTLPAALSFFPKPLAQCHVTVIPTAANVYPMDNRPWFDDELNTLKQAGATLHMLDLAQKSSAEVSAELAISDVVHVTGGNSYHLLEHAQKTNITSTLPAFFQRGGVYIGSSAGTVLACPRIDFTGSMDDPSKGAPTSFRGLNLVPYIVMPHYDHPKYGALAKTLLHALPSNETGLALADTQALWVQNNVVQFIQA
ncbi:MAG: hypothetical protein GC129_00295 [Proteobacteria bacterium]|nr:hypothetical protein [Pseudomonadota bacterium]